MNESAIERRLTKWVEDQGGRCLKLGIGIKGFPDRAVILPGGRILFIEMKRKGGRVAPLQRYWQKTLRELRFVSEIAFSFDEAVEIIKEVQNE